jgi:hypothetical protein
MDPRLIPAYSVSPSRVVLYGKWIDTTPTLGQEKKIEKFD